MTEFPNDYTRNKDKKWHKDYVESIWKDFSGLGISIFSKGVALDPITNAYGPYHSIDAFMEGRQDESMYAPFMGVEEASNESWLTLDWTIFPAMPKQLNVVGAILAKSRYGVGFVPQDVMATDRKNKWFAQMKARMEVREEIARNYAQEADGIARSLGVDRQPDEPIDSEELEMQRLFLWKDVVATEWTKAVAAVNLYNRVEDMRLEWHKNLIYYGVGGYKNFIDRNGIIRARAADPKCIVVSWCKNRDFSDAKYIGERVQMSMEDFAKENSEMDEKHLLQVANTYAAASGGYASTWDGAKTRKLDVLDVEWRTTRVDDYDTTPTKYNNPAISKSKKASGPNVLSVEKVVWHRAKWVVGSDILWDWGVCPYMLHEKGNLSEFQPSYYFFAPMMSDMRIQSIGQLVQPILNQVQISWLKLQKAIADYRSRGIWIDFTPLDNISFGKGGAALKPEEVVELYLQKNIGLFRSNTTFDPNGKQNPPPFHIGEGTGMEDVLAWHNALQFQIQALKDAIGLNDYTDASTPDARSLGATVQTAQESTNNALYGIMDAEARIMKRLSESTVIRLYDMKDMGTLDAMAPAIGEGSVEFLKSNPNGSPLDWNIDIRRLPLAEDKRMLIEDAKALAGNGMIEYEDIVLIETMDNLQDARHLLAYRTKKRKQEQEQQSLRLQEQNAQVQAQSAIAIEQERQKTVAAENEAKIKVAEIQAAAMVEVAKINAGASTTGNIIKAGSQAQNKQQNFQ